MNLFAFKTKSFLAFCSVFLSISMAKAEGPDIYSISTSEGAGVSTECSSGPQPNFSARLPVLQGRLANIRIARHFVDVGIVGINVSSCDGACSIRIVEKGNSALKGFVQLELRVAQNAPLGNAAININYITGGVGTYPIKIVRQAVFTSISTTNSVSNQNDRITLSGSNLDDLDSSEVRFLQSPEAPFRRVSGTNTQLVYAPTGPICNANSLSNPTVRYQDARGCKAELPRYQFARDASCAADASSPRPPAIVQPPPRVVAPQPTTNITPVIPRLDLVMRSIRGPIPTANGSIHQLFDNFCGSMTANIVNTVNVPPLQWGARVTGPTNLGFNFQIELLDGSTGRRLQSSEVPVGTIPADGQVMRSNYPGRPTQISVIKDFVHPVEIVGNQASPRRVELGCYTAPGTTVSFDPSLNNGIVRVDTGNTIIESNENDNELRF
jgi:hypothetical protein